jgi:hypothetical protein
MASPTLLSLMLKLEHVHGILKQMKNISKNACKASGTFCPFPIAHTASEGCTLQISQAPGIYKGHK